MNYSLILTAGGKSTRYGKNNKLLEKIIDKTVIEETVSKFLEFNEINEIIIAANVSIITTLKDLFKQSQIKIIEGGTTRQASVYNGLKLITNEYVLIHDGARPLIKKEIITKTLNDVIKYNAISVMVKTTDTIKEIDEQGKIIKTLDRTKLYNTQTPQAFKTSIIKECHEKLVGGNYTDDCSMLEKLGKDVYMIEGDYTNIKITTKSDLKYAQMLMNSKM